jgi:hypothetical protein
MENTDLISLIPFQQSIEEGQITRWQPLLASLTNLNSLNNPIQQQPLYQLESYTIDNPIDPSLVNIKEFANKFKDIKHKLTGIEATILDLERRKEMIRNTYSDVTKKLVEFFGFSETHESVMTLKRRAYDMVSNLDLDRYYEERNALLEHYKVAVPLLEEVKNEFFAEEMKASCPICYENNVTHVLLPCGHTLCDNCKKKVLSSCYLCRASVNKINKIFI